MKRFTLAISLACFLAVGALPTVATAASDVDEYHEYDDSVLNPFRIAYHLIYPFGYATEWLIGRPFHYIISRPGLDKVFGYQEPGSDEATRGHARF